MLRKLLCFVAVLGLSQTLAVPSDLANERSAARLGEQNRYLFFSRARPNTGIQIVDLAGVQAEFITGAPVIIIVHGFEGSSSNTINPHLKDEILFTYESKNVVVVDWAGVAGSSYVFASGAVPSVAANLAGFISLVIQGGFTADQIHLIGFDLGAHVCGFAGRALDGAIGRITGLSPRGDGWADSRGPLARGDALVVEIIHTNNNLGIERPLGDRDIYINNGRVQPGCSNHQCHHNRAHQIMTASIAHKITANACETLADMTSNRCRSGRPIDVGSLEFKVGSGIFRANTPANFPFV